MEQKKTHTDKEKFDGLVKKLKSYGFRLIEKREKTQYYNSLDIMPPKNRKPRPGQVAFLYTHMNGTKIICWSSFTSTTGELIAKGLASAWVLILDEKGEAPHKSRPIRRVGEFCNRIAYQCIINKMRVEGSAYCHLCGAKTELAWRKDYIGARYWKCSKPENHKGEKTPTYSFDAGVKGKYLTYVKKRNKARVRYSKARRKIGKDPQHAMKTRRKWQKKPI